MTMMQMLVEFLVSCKNSWWLVTVYLLTFSLSCNIVCWHVSRRMMVDDDDDDDDDYADDSQT